MGKFKVLIYILAMMIPSAAVAQGKSPKTKCLETARNDVAVCMRQLPPSVRPKDPKKPTQAEKDAAARRAAAESRCNKMANEKTQACNRLSNNPT